MSENRRTPSEPTRSGPPAAGHEAAPSSPTHLSEPQWSAEEPQHGADGAARHARRRRPEPRLRGGTKGALIGGACVVVVGVAGYGGYTTFHGRSGTTAAGHAARKPSPRITTAPSAAEVATTAREFLTAWSSGDTRKAAGLTDDAAQAAGQLDVLRTRLHATSVTLTGRPARGTSVPFSVEARFRYNGEESSWRYGSTLTVGRDGTGRPAVKWAPSVLYPTLGPGESLRTDRSVPPPLTVVDRRGRRLTSAEYPSLGSVLGQLQANYATATGGSPGTEIRVRDASGKAGTPLHRLSGGTPGKPLATTIDARLQGTAEEAVKSKGRTASTVVLQPSTGAILAIADRPSGGYDTAMSGNYAPGSTFKLITASTALQTGKVAPDKPLNCPKNYDYGGQRFHNVDNFSLHDATMAEDFAQSCNTAFISTATFLPDDAVSREAHDDFGVGLDWHVGVPAYSGSVPEAVGAMKAQSYIGQGKDLMSPLAMASVASTVKASGFHQPFLVPPSVDHRALAQAPGHLSGSVADQVRSMMRLTARSGTAAPAMKGIGGDVGAKTGTAEVDGQTKPNSWFVAYRGDVAAAATVPDSGEGFQYAGPIVAAILKAAG